ncbi:molybdopterin-guanine dinucleotide biosynthesis protein B [Paenibacillus polysaccharolyticus]|uniref:molybdopterin-guanine dinucleotide biosynthesis protein B n=1 Tax=Paenibacillus polysaccharolyticus TaxID=582692 RepID=UPI00203E9365|nr:molybdopterin-guanine dinucleotide biosynthesis protein B [Paenibacillus polysaccharolyticus]MCM3133008.1 molybdopterin-guanine dinucleotide biosynthesis protein B [Paenibacillus polysaccharolyticus]
MENKTTSEPKVIQVVGYKNTGKTTMTAALIAGLASKGLKVAAIKHDGHDHFEMDQEGTDSFQFGKAGATAVAVMSEKRTAIIKQHNTRLDDMLSQFSDYDWIVIEGFKNAPYPKLVMVREADDRTLVRKLQQVVGVVFWAPELLKEAEMLNVHIEKDQHISKKAMASFLFHEREVIVEALLQLQLTNVKYDENETSIEDKPF